MLYRDEPDVKDIDMLHAPDYGQMGLQQLTNKMKERKKRDCEIETSMLYVLHFQFAVIYFNTMSEFPILSNITLI